ncbi:hypothetical protein M8C21_033199, partial [Ambrosia artemisiifolia]
FCVDSESGNGGYRCTCNNGYQGNPYLSPGCQDIDECADPNDNPCFGICSNFPGHFNCSCPDGYVGDGRKDGRGCTPRNSKSPALRISLGTVFGFLFVLVGITWLYFSHKRRKKNRLLHIVDEQVLREANHEQLQAIAFLVKRCLSMNGSDRPKMKEVAEELAGLKDFSQHPWANQSANEDGLSLIDKSKQPDLYDIPASSSKSSFNIASHYSSDQILLLMNIDN